MKRYSMPAAALALSAAAGLFWNVGPAVPARYALVCGLLSVGLLPLLLTKITDEGLRASGCLLILPVLMGALSAFYARELWRFYQQAYPGQIGLPAFWLLLLLGCGCYLYNGRRGFARYHHLLFVLLAAAVLVLIVSLAGSARLSNLQYASSALETSALVRGFLLQFQLWPEYFFLAGAAAEKRRLPAAQGGVGLTVGLQTLLILLAELCLGAAAFAYPFYGAACLGQVSVFTRLDQLQVIVWTMLLLFKLGFYLLAVLRSPPLLQAAAALAAAAVLLAERETGLWVLQLILWLALLAAIGGSAHCRKISGKKSSV